MNLAEIDSDTRERLLKREECIGLFVFQGRYHWIIAWEAFFILIRRKISMLPLRNIRTIPAFWVSIGRPTKSSVQGWVH